MADDRKAVEGAIDFAIQSAGAAPTSRIGAAGWIQGAGYDWLTGRINSGSSLGAEGSILNKLIQGGYGGSFILPLSDKGAGEVDLVPLVGTGSATFTRATTATTVNSAGLIVSVASGTPRSYYDPTTLAYRGYLAEGARTNLCLQSSDLSAADWLIDGGTKTANFSTSPDGTTNAGRYVTAAVANLRQVITVTASTQYTFSFYAKANGGTQASYRVYNITGGADIVPITSYFSSINSSTWTRITVSFTTPVGCTSIGVYMNSNASADTLLWGMQVEAGAFTSSYIPTTTASVPRNADVLTYPFSGNADTTVGSAYAELSTFNTGAAVANPAAVNFGNGGRTLFLLTGAAVTSIGCFDSTNAISKTGLSSMATASRKRASSWGSGLLVTGDGLTTQSGSFDGSMGTSTEIAIGNNGGIEQWFGTIRNVRIYQTQLSSAQLQTITA